MVKNDEIAVLIYDGDCKLCQNGKKWIEKRALAGKIEFLPCQSPQLKIRFPLIKTDKCMQAIHLVLSNSKILVGADATPEILARIKGWRWAEKILRLKMIRWISPKIYAWIASNRQIISCKIFPHTDNYTHS